MRRLAMLAVLAVLAIACDLDLPLDACGSNLQCDPSTLCARGKCRPRCQHSTECEPPDRCYLNNKEAPDGGYFASCAPYDPNYIEVP